MEWRALRRKDRAMAQEDTQALLARGEYGVLATADETGLPLATPLSYVYMDGSIYFHGAASGHKLENLAANPRVCFCVVDGVEAVYDNSLSTYYQSAMAHGTATVVQQAEEKRRALLALSEKYLPDYMAEAHTEIKADTGRTCVVRIDIQHLAGKSKPRKP